MLPVIDVDALEISYFLPDGEVCKRAEDVMITAEAYYKLIAKGLINEDQLEIVQCGSHYRDK